MIVTFPVTSLWLWHILGPHYECDTSWDLSMIETLPGGSIIVELPGASSCLWDLIDLSMIVAFPVPLIDCNPSWTSLWLWYFKGPLWLWHFLGSLYDWHTHWGRCMIAALPCTSLGTLYDCDTLWGISMIVTLPWESLWVRQFLGPLYDCGTSWTALWLRHSLKPLYDCDTSWDLSMIVTLPGTGLWLRDSLGPLYDCDTSWGLSMTVALPGTSLWLRHSL